MNIDLSKRKININPTTKRVIWKPFSLNTVYKDITRKEKDNMHNSCKNALEEIDALLFSGDLSEQDIIELKQFFTRWERELKNHEDVHASLANDNLYARIKKFDQESLNRIFLGDKFDAEEKTDSTHARIKKFNQLIEPQLLELDKYERELATMFLIGYLKGHTPIDKIEEVSDQLSTFIERDLS